MRRKNILLAVSLLALIAVVGISHRLIHKAKQANALAGTNQVRLNNMTYGSGLRKEASAISQYICQRSADAHMTDLCREWPEYERIIGAVSRTMGYPSQVLSCVYMIESKFKKGPRKQGVCSHKGACGLAQIMPASAREMQRAMKASAGLQKSWAQFRRELGGDTSPRDFTAAAMRGSGDKVDVQLFATALYFRHHYAAFEKTWQSLIEKDPTKIIDYYHFLAIGYNAGPRAAGHFLAKLQKNEKSAYRQIPRVTKRYVRDMDDCMLNQGFALSAR